MKSRRRTPVYPTRHSSHSHRLVLSEVTEHTKRGERKTPGHLVNLSKKLTTYQ